jgi:carbon storage regulator
MLVLTRQKDEVVRIAGLIRIQVLWIKGKQVRLGIDAPADIVVDREEIYLRKLEEELRAALARAEAAQGAG